MQNCSPRIVSTSCEGEPQPLGVETIAPRLTWQIEGIQRQIAYQVQVATQPQLLAQGEADLWDSGRVESSQSVLVPYAGAPLLPRMRCYWRVRIWNETNQARDYSEISWWEMGLLSSLDWSPQCQRE